MALRMITATLIPAMALGHVKLFFDVSQGSDENPMAIRNANTATGDGSMSVGGPCGGAAAFGANGVHATESGRRIAMRINYNGGHRSPNNEFHVIYACTADGPTQGTLKAIADDTAPGGLNDMMTIPLETGTMPAPKADKPNYVDASTGNSVATGYTMMFTIPENASGLCTFSVLDQRDWGGCHDMMITKAPTPAPTPAPPPTVPGQTPVPTTTTTTTTEAPIMGSDVAGVYATPVGSCQQSFSTCCCIWGQFNLVHWNESRTSNGMMMGMMAGATNTTMTSMIRVLPHNASNHYLDTCTDYSGEMPGGLNTTIQQNDRISLMAEGRLSGAPANGMRAPEEMYRFRIDRGRISFENAGSGQPSYCDGFAIRWTETAAQIDSAVQSYMAAEQMTSSLLAVVAENVNGTGATPENRAMLRQALSNMSTHYGRIQQLAPGATEDERLFAGNMTNMTWYYNNISAAAQMVAGNAPITESPGTDAAIAVGIIVILALVAAAVIFRERIASFLGASESPSVYETENESDRVMIEHDSDEVAPVPTRRPPPRAAPRLALNDGYVPQDPETQSEF